METISPETLHNKLKNGESPVLLDVREQWEFDICRIEGATLLPMNQVLGAMASMDKEAETVVICHHGTRSQQVAQYLESQGFSRVANLDGGIDAWARNIDPDMEQY